MHKTTCVPDLSTFWIGIGGWLGELNSQKSSARGTIAPRDAISRSLVDTSSVTGSHSTSMRDRNNNFPLALLHIGWIPMPFSIPLNAVFAAEYPTVICKYFNWFTQLNWDVLFVFLFSRVSHNSAPCRTVNEFAALTQWRRWQRYSHLYWRWCHACRHSVTWHQTTNKYSQWNHKIK